jgi:hypothetical protein
MHTRKGICVYVREKMRMREKTFVQYLFTATSISKYRKRSKQASISENKNRSRRRQFLLFDKLTLYIYFIINRTINIQHIKVFGECRI